MFELAILKSLKKEDLIDQEEYNTALTLLENEMRRINV